MTYNELKRLARQHHVNTVRETYPHYILDGEELFQSLIKRGVIPYKFQHDDYHCVQLGVFGFFSVFPAIDKDTTESSNNENKESISSSLVETTVADSSGIVSIREYLDSLSELFINASSFSVISFTVGTTKSEAVILSGDNIFTLSSNNNGKWEIINVKKQ